MTSLEEEIKKRGLKVTPQRSKILRRIRENPGSHFSADDIHKYVQIESPNIPPATVYNILKMFVEKGLINSFEINGKAIYEGKVDPHINFMCENCHNIYDYEMGKDLSEIENNVEGKIISTNVTIKGICKSCLKDLETSETSLMH
ncbi:MAG: Fur family transcriptional regulator [Cuniculiplasma sp.]